MEWVGYILHAQADEWNEMLSKLLICAQKLDIIALVNTLLAGTAYPTESRIYSGPTSPVFDLTTPGRFYQHRWILIRAWISNHMPSNVWDEIVYPIPNFNGTAVEVWGWMSNSIPYIITDVITYVLTYVLGSKLLHVLMFLFMMVPTIWILEPLDPLDDCLRKSDLQVNCTDSEKKSEIAFRYNNPHLSAKMAFLNKLVETTKERNRLSLA